MTIKDAVVKRFKNLCQELSISITELSRASGMTPSTVYSMFEPTRRQVQLSTVKKLVDGISYYKKDFTVIDFFNDPLFEKLEQEIE